MPDYGTSCYNSTGSHCSGGPQPGAVALSVAVRGMYVGIGTLGVYNCRPSSGGGGLSTHGEGRGWDAACNANTSAGLFIGNRLAADLVKHYRELGVQRIIWNTRITDVPNGMGNWRAYHGTSPHKDHLHIELCWAAARDKPLTVDYVRQVLGGEEDDLTPDQAKKLEQIWEGLYEKRDGKVFEATDEIRDLCKAILAKLNEPGG